MQPANVSTSERQYIRCRSKRRRLGAVLLMGMGLMTGEAFTVAKAQSLTPDPGTWRPMSYADLQRPSQVTATYTDIWKDAIEEDRKSVV